jgi:hypothetical protein
MTCEENMKDSRLERARTYRLERASEPNGSRAKAVSCIEKERIVCCLCCGTSRFRNSCIPSIVVTYWNPASIVVHVRDYSFRCPSMLVNRKS